MLKTIAKNTLFLSVSQVVGRAIGFLYFIFLARVLGVSSFGTYAFISAFVYNFIPVADFGVERFVLRDISRTQTDSQEYFSKLLPLRIILAIIAYFGVLILGFVLKRSFYEISLMAIFGLAIIPYNIIYLFLSLLNAKEKMQYVSGVNIFLITITALFGVCFYLLGQNLLIILFSYPMANLIILIYFLFRAKSWKFTLKLTIDLKFIKNTISESWIFAFYLISAVLYLRLSTIMTGLLLGSQATGLYSSAYKFVEAIILVPQSLGLALFPTFSRTIINEKEKIKKIYVYGLGILLLFSLPFALVFIFANKQLVEIAYGKDYLQAVPIFPILGFAIILFFMNSLAGNIIQTSNKVKKFLPYTLINFFAAFIFCLVLIPKFSIIGASLAVVGGEIVGLVINNIFIYKLLKND